jgi:hypothetical protein
LIGWLDLNNTYCEREMIDFDRWLNRSEKVAKDRAHIEALEDAGIIDEMKDGTFMATCCCCGNRTELPVGPDEIDLGYEHYCGGSDRCCP